MATILIVDDRPANREYLMTLLEYGGHRLLQAADGAEALATARAEHPNLVIADILMPTMDGYEFVRQLRADPAVAPTPVVFCTAHFHEREARNLADACGVTHVLTKPCEPEVVLRTVDAALGVAAAPAPAPLAEEFDREHLRLLTDKLSEKADELRRANERLTALVDLGLELGSERDPRQVLQSLCRAAREIIGAKYAIAGILAGDGLQIRDYFTCGMDAETATRLGSPDPRRGGIGTVLREARCLRLHNLGGNPVAIDFPSSYPPLHSWLGAPIASPGRVYGWLGLLNKVGAEMFSDEDERLAGILAAQVGRVYENGRLYADVLNHAAELELEVAERTRAEAALKESEERLQRAIECAAIPIMIHAQDGRVVQLSKAWTEITGYSPAELPTIQAWVGTAYGEQMEKVQAHMQKLYAMELGAQEGGEFHVRTRSGETRVWAFRSAPLGKLSSGQRLVISTAMDITNRKRAEEALREREEHIRLLLDSTAEAIHGIDMHGHCTFANSACARLLGYADPRQLLGKNMHALIHHTRGDGTPYLEQECRIFQAFRKGEGSHVEDEVLWRADGSSFPAEYWSYPIRHEERIVGSVVTFLDITERRRLADQFRQAQQRLQHVVASSPAVLLTLAIAGDQIQGVSWISDNLLEILGHRPEAALSPDWWVGNIHPEDRDRIIGQTHAELLSHGRANHEYRFRHGDGSYRWTRGEQRLIRDGTGQAVEVVGSWSDITERKQLEDQFRQAQKMEAVGRLAGGVAHDFNNLLTVINGYGELVLGRLPAGDPTRELIREVVAAGNRAAGLTRQLLAFSRKAIIEPKVLDLKAMMADVDKMLRRIIGEDIQLSILADPELDAVKADPGQIEQVILNLVVNARDAMPQGGRLTIEVRNAELDETYAQSHPDARPGRHVLMAVSDTGCGMDQATMARIFEPFFSTKGERGTGLGLATVHGIVKQSGGHVGVYSEVGHGTTFKVYLPRVAQRPTSGKSSPGLTVLPRGSETVLLVEDEDGVRALARHVLQLCGYTVLEARDGAEAVRIAGQHQGKIDLVVTDVVMPRMGGREVTERTASLHPGVKVLFLSGYTDDAVVRHGILEAEVAFLQKPFSPASLAAKVRDVLDTK
jgi:two-component system cell cycle sensor histidine kinase/response regulator CckA